jgi:hypothetical protein
MRHGIFMTQFNALASKLRINILLCCSAAVLLTGCGGNIDASGEQLPATAAAVSTDAGAPIAANIVPPAAAVEAIAEAAPAASTETGPAASTETAAAASTGAAPIASIAGATGQTAKVTAGAFELAGYDSNPLQARTGQQNAGASAPAPIRQ